ncbi:hypothetical protein PENTCL1PPCAC_21169, partial [Pristionchus entomophagus]
WRLLLVLSIWQIVHSSCPSGFELIRDGECRGLYTSLTLYTDEAYGKTVAKCKEIQAQPIIIHNQNHQSYWMDWREKNGSTPWNIWPIGLTCNTNTKKWVWSDGSAVDYYKPANGVYYTELDQNCK